ncbi:tyrosine-type recombinase/integrase [Paenibacillus sacheonensis]|uniref:Tyrosine-type recombinase/integrase n=1 Tax=Paenibacillus sacheonensis TaxID=742054 RepID=A0A7X4YQT6_9BACL|nr:tyrosine-type recombinase/integrase [Paenibacillus sacheonensis]MBM7567925.1 site-specific recombinase XerD [Paenibacillus sacheonensis]NBC70810.1 tyrosine-type recombinase/integrase [Paenibacillus sacheonensis]
MITSNGKAVNIKENVWKIDHVSSRGKYLTFYFDYLPNYWFKNVHKQATIECFTKQNPKVDTLHRYNYSLKHFFNFLSEANKSIKNYSEVNNNTIQDYITYLKQKGMSNSTANVCMASLKWIIYHGQRFEYEEFPKSEVFDGDEFQALRVDDFLKTKIISDQVLKQIESALSSEENGLLKPYLEIGIDTGIRLGEVLDLKVGCITESFNGTPILHVINEKNNSERWIPVSKRVSKAVDWLTRSSAQGREYLNTEYLNIISKSEAKKISDHYARLTQNMFRERLEKFVIKHRIVDSNDTLYNLNFHAFRHTIGTHMINRGMTSFEIQEYLGHSSLHSTALYSKVQSPKIIEEHNNIGFVGVIARDVKDKSGTNIEGTTLKQAALPDGICRKPIDGEGLNCKSFNLCLLCPKFMTTPDYLLIHKQHLERIEMDSENYMREEYIGSFDHLTKVESSLKEIIERLEEMKNTTTV